MKLINENITERFDDFKDYYERIPEEEQEHTDLATKLYDTLSDAGYTVYGRETGEGYEISKKFEKNLEKAKKICSDMNIPCHTEQHRDRYYLVIDLDGIDYERVVESLKNDEIDQFFKLAKRMDIKTMKDLDMALNEPEAYNKDGKKKASELNQLRALAKGMKLGHRDYSKHEYEPRPEEGESEPVTESIDKEELLSHAPEFRYQLLDRLKSDCDYYLGYGNRDVRHLWALNPEDQIEAMRILYNSFPDDQKPEWLTLDDIDNYASKMIIKEEPVQECITEDAEETAELTTPDIETSEASEVEIESGLVTIINDLINDENEAINGYESAIVNLEIAGKGDLTDAIREILSDEQKHVGSLQVILNEIKPGTQTEIEAGKEETLDILNNESEPEEVVNIDSIETIG